MSASPRPLTFLLTLAVAACASGTSTSEPAAGPAATPPPAQQPAAEPATTADTGGAHFTAEQADEGRDTFRSLCTECHFSGEFSDAQFKFKWSRRTAGNLFEMIFTQMPESAPGSLSPDEAASLVAYILRMNGFEEGSTPLPADADALSGISLRSIRN